MLKRIGIGLGIFVGVIVLAAALFVVFFPKDAAIAEAQRRIEEATGRELTLGGEVQLAFWPALGFSAEQASLSNPEGFGDAPFLAADRIVFAVAVMPLLRGAIEVKQLVLEGADLNLIAQADGDANWEFPTEQSEGQPATLNDLRLDEVRLSGGTISFQGAEGAPMQLDNVDAELKLDSLDAPATMQSAFNYRGERLTVASTIGSPRAILEQGETPLTGDVASGPLSAEFDGAFNVATGALSGALNANGESLRRLMAWVGSPMGEGGGFGAYRLAAQVAHSGNETRLTDASLSLDAITATGALTLVTQESGRLRIGGALNTADLDINPYLPPPPQGEGGVEVSTAWSEAPLDLSGLRALDADLDLTIGALSFQRMRFSDVAMALRIANGVADARLTRIALYQGGGTARLIADGSGATPRVGVELDARDIQAEPLLTDAIGFDKIAGRGRLTVSLVGQGASQAALMRSLSGNMSFNFNDGQWKGVNLAQIARTIQAAATGLPATGGGATDFAELSSNFRVAGGVAATDNLRLLNPFVRLEGQGVIDIGQQAIDMRIAPRAVSSIQGQGGEAGVAGIGVPFRVHGPWASARAELALGDIVQNELRARIGGILGQRGDSDPLGSLAGAVLGRPASTPAPEDEAAAPADGDEPAPAAPEKQRTPEDQVRDALGGLFGNN